MEQQMETAPARAVPSDPRREDLMVQRRLHRDDTFWRSHELQRRQQGLSIPQYCKATGLALSTFRHRINQLAAADGMPTSDAVGGRFIPLGTCPPALQGEALELEVIVPESMTLRLHGAAARLVLDRVLARLP